MPFADTGLAAPNNFTNSAGVFNCTERHRDHHPDRPLRPHRRHLRRDQHQLRPPAPSTSGGTNGQHDCTTPGGGGAGNTAGLALRLLRAQQDRRAWRAAGCPPTPGCTPQLTTNVNLNQTCNAFWNGAHDQLLPLGRRLPEHRRDRRRVRPRVGPRPRRQRRQRRAVATPARATPTSRPSTACRPPASATASSGPSNDGCGMTADGTGFNAERGPDRCGRTATPTARACATPTGPSTSTNTPDTALGFVCSQLQRPAAAPAAGRCTARRRPSRQAAWDLVARDLAGGAVQPRQPDAPSSSATSSSTRAAATSAPGTPAPAASSSNGCGATNGYMQWLAADDDNGNLNDGTPHMTAHLRRLQPPRHRLRHARPRPTAAAPAARPRPRRSPPPPGNNQVVALLERGRRRHPLLGVPHRGPRRLQLRQDADRRGDRHQPTPTPRSANGRPYSYNVVAAGASSGCFGRASNCVTVTPASAPGPAEPGRDRHGPEPDHRDLEPGGRRRDLPRLPRDGRVPAAARTRCSQSGITGTTYERQHRVRRPHLLVRGHLRRRRQLRVRASATATTRWPPAAARWPRPSRA